MARMSVDFLKRVLTVAEAWETLRPKLLLFRMTVQEFKDLVKPSFTKRVEIERVRASLERLIAERNALDRRTSRATQRVVNAVRGDPGEGGEDGELYAAMGYMTWSEKCEKVRQASLTRLRRASARAAHDQSCQADDDQASRSPDEPGLTKRMV